MATVLTQSLLLASERLDELVILEIRLNGNNLIDEHPARVQVLPVVQL